MIYQRSFIELDSQPNAGNNQRRFKERYFGLPQKNPTTTRVKAARYWRLCSLRYSVLTQVSGNGSLPISSNG